MAVETWWKSVAVSVFFTGGCGVSSDEKRQGTGTVCKNDCTAHLFDTVCWMLNNWAARDVASDAVLKNGMMTNLTANYIINLILDDKFENFNWLRERGIRPFRASVGIRLQDSWGRFAMKFFWLNLHQIVGFFRACWDVMMVLNPCSKARRCSSLPPYRPGGQSGSQRCGLRVETSSWRDWQFHVDMCEWQGTWKHLWMKGL